jgi:hypothetical protein
MAASQEPVSSVEIVEIIIGYKEEIELLFNCNRDEFQLFATCFHPRFLLGLFFDPEDGMRHIPPKRR